jgi:hypothetical protein
MRQEKKVRRKLEKSKKKLEEKHIISFSDAYFRRRKKYTRNANNMLFMNTPIPILEID